MNTLIAIKEIESVRKLHAQMDSLVISNIQRISNNNVIYILLEYKIKERPPNLFHEARTAFITKSDKDITRKL